MHKINIDICFAEQNNIVDYTYICVRLHGYDSIREGKCGSEKQALPFTLSRSASSVANGYGLESGVWDDYRLLS